MIYLRILKWEKNYVYTFKSCNVEDLKEQLEKILKQQGKKIIIVVNILNNIIHGILMFLKLCSVMENYNVISYNFNTNL